MDAIFQKLESFSVYSLDVSPERFSAKQEDVEHLENIFGFRFPPSYVDCLLRYGMFGFESVVHFPAPDSWSEPDTYAANDVRVFYGISEGRDFDDFKLWDLGGEIKRARHDELPKHFLPICESDGLPTVIYISCQEQDYGHVYALTRTQIWNKMNGLISTEEVCEAAFHIAHSFEEFVELLDDEVE